MSNQQLVRRLAQPPAHPASGIVKWPLLLVLLLAAAIAFAVWLFSEPEQVQLAAEPVRLTQADAISRSAVSRADLPPAGTRSLLDYIVAENEGIPYPFDKFVELLASYDKDGRAPDVLLVPFSRSLLKGQSDLARPRLVLASNARPGEANGELQPYLKGRLFLGYTEEANEIEAISYNEQAGRFEYQIISDYQAGASPKLLYAKRNLCLSCHQNEAAIFPLRPWQETNAEQAVTQAILQAMGPASEHVKAGHYFTAPLDSTLAAAEAIDNLTDISTTITSAQRAWVDGCGAEGGQCRQALLGLALRYALQPGRFDFQSAEVSKLKDLQAQNWPAAGISLGNGDINNRNPLAPDASERLPLRERWASAIKQRWQDLVAQAPADGSFEDQPRLKAALDPLTPRPIPEYWQADEADALLGIAQLFSASDIALIRDAIAENYTLLNTALESTEMQQLFERALPLHRPKLMRILMRQLGVAELSYCCENSEQLSAASLAGEPPLELADGDVLQHYQDYCFACHRDNPVRKLNFLSGASAEAVLAGIVDKPGIADVLDWPRYLGTAKASQLMPPANSDQRIKLQQAIDSGENPLPEMIEVVPSLFELFD